MSLPLGAVEVLADKEDSEVPEDQVGREVPEQEEEQLRAEGAGPVGLEAIAVAAQEGVGGFGRGRHRLLRRRGYAAGDEWSDVYRHALWAGDGARSNDGQGDMEL